MSYDVELTDTFAGEANYTWVRRAVVPSPTETRYVNPKGRGDYSRTVMRRAKAAVGMSGVRGVTSSFGDGYEFRPYRMCVVMFVTWRDQDDETADDERKPHERPAFYECGICGAYHAASWNGDCRQDDARFFSDELDARYGGSGWEAVSMPGTDGDPND